jgi:hypothetical protein
MMHLLHLGVQAVQAVRWELLAAGLALPAVGHMQGALEEMVTVRLQVEAVGQVVLH